MYLLGVHICEWLNEHIPVRLVFLDVLTPFCDYCSIVPLRLTLSFLLDTLLLSVVRHLKTVKTVKSSAHKLLSIIGKGEAGEAIRHNPTVGKR